MNVKKLKILEEKGNTNVNAVIGTIPTFFFCIWKDIDSWAEKAKKNRNTKKKSE